MKKQLLCLLVLCLVIPMSSFKNPTFPTTNWFIGFFDQNGHTYSIYGDNQGGSSGNVTQILDGATLVGPITHGPNHIWGNTYGVGSDLLGVTVSFNGGGYYSGVVYQ
jgi:hypothetical protein